MKMIKDSDKAFTNLRVDDKTTTIVHNIHMRVLNTVVLELTGFALLQLIHGAKAYMLKQATTSQIALVLLFKLIEQEIEVSHQCATCKNLIYNSNELIIMRKWIEARLAHCEEEKFMQSPKFNPDTYVSLKFLLLDIRELLMGEIIEMSA